MSLRVSNVEAKSGFSKLVKHAREEPVIVTRPGEPDAVILPSAHYECLRPLAACSSTVRLSRELKEADMTTTELYQGSRCEME
jgi:prevent-host-death family protein